MNIGNECYIVYDKFGGSHSFKNPMTKKYKIKDLFERIVNDETIQYVAGEAAIAKFNNKFGDGSNFRLPADLNQDIITIHLFEFKNEDNCEIIITIIGVDIAKLTEFYEKYNDIPNRDFIINSCRFHISYEKTVMLENTEKTTSVKEIIDKVIVPSSNITDPKIKDPEFIVDGFKLYDYQKRTIKSMLNTETEIKKIHYGNNYRYEIEIGPFVFDIISKTLLKRDSRESIIFKGGSLIDEVGLGKTLQMLVLCMLNQLPANKLSYIDQSNNMLKSRATLVISPSQVTKQWLREIESKLSYKKIKVITMLSKIEFDKYTYQDLLDADFVLVSFDFISNPCFTGPYTKKITTSKSYHKSAQWNQEKVKTVFNEMSELLASDPTSLLQKKTLFPLISWHRIIIDEFHEPYTVDKYVPVKNIIPLLVGTYKWSMTGTPFEKGSECFLKMFDFATEYKNKLGDNIIEIKEIKDHMTEYFFRRNTKQSTEEENKLPGLKEKIIWLKFTPTERMMYNAYLTDPNVDKFSEIVRQLCCHPKIADEIKGVLSNCKTLEEIEKSMVSHYKTQYRNAFHRVCKCKHSIAKTKRRILVAEFRRYRRFLKQEGFKVKIELPAFEFKVDENPDFKDENLILDDDPNIDDPNLNPNPDNDNNDNNDNDNNDDLNLDNPSDDDEDSDDEKPLMIVSTENLPSFINLIKRQLKAIPSQTINNLNESLVAQNQRLVDANKVCDGKKASYKFFNNMLESIKKATEKSKKKYLKQIARDNSDSESESGDEEEGDSDDCGICLGEISGDNLGVTNCGHHFCYECLKLFVNNSAKCPMCNNPQKITDISRISFEKPVFTQQNSEIIKNKMELINKVGTKLTNLIYFLNSIPDKVIIFSQWDSLLKKVGDVLTEHGIKNVFCRGNVWTRDKAIRDFSNDGNNIKAIMLSSESAASGTNLTKANVVIFLDIVSGAYERRRDVEWQAIGRSFRLGQTKVVEVVRFIIKDTVEEEIYRDNQVENAKHQSNLVISEVTDETITLSDDKLQSITSAVQNAKTKKENKELEKQKKLASKTVKKPKKKQENENEVKKLNEVNEVVVEKVAVKKVPDKEVAVKKAPVKKVAIQKNK